MKKLSITITLVATMIGGVFTLVNQKTNIIPDVPTVMVIVTKSATASQVRTLMADLAGKEIYVYANENIRNSVKVELKKQKNITEGFWSPDNTARVETASQLIRLTRGFEKSREMVVIQI